MMFFVREKRHTYIFYVLSDSKAAAQNWHKPCRQSYLLIFVNLDNKILFTITSTVVYQAQNHFL